MRFFIAIERLVGLDKFSDEDYFLIRFDTFKPLFISFALELLWKNNLQHRLITEKLM